MRRKLFALLFVVLMAFALVACEDKNERAVEDALKQIAVPTEAQTGFKVPAKVKTNVGDVTLTWKSSNENVLKVAETVTGDEYTVLAFLPEDEDVEVNLTVTAKLKKIEKKKEFTVLVKAPSGEVYEELSSEVLEQLIRELTLQDRAASDIIIPQSLGYFNVNITWASNKTEVLDTKGRVVRPQGLGTGVKLVATVAGTVVETGEELDPVERTFYVYVYGNDIDINGVYNQAFGEVNTLNPLNSTSSSESDVYDLLVDSLYNTDYNWYKGIEEGFAQFPGDFSNIRGRNETPFDAPDKTEMPALARTFVLGMAADFPISVDKNSNFEKSIGVLDDKAAKENQDDEWIIKLRKDLKFADGREIDAHVFEYSFKQYLDGNQNNERANYLYNGDYIPLKNGEAYFKQGRPLDDEDPEKGVWPETSWDEVGFKIIDKYTFKLTLETPVTQWHLMTYLGIVCLVHPEKFEAGFDTERKVTNYGSIENIPVSYGPYVLSNWEDGKQFTFTRNENFYDKHKYTIKTINGPIITDQSQIINEFKAGRLDITGVGGAYWNEFKNDANLYIAPSNSFYRFAISLDRTNGTSGKETPPILLEKEFRKALYLATDRQDYTDTVQPPSQPALGYLSNIHQVNEAASGAYASSAQHLNVLAELGLKPEQKGYDIEEARNLFKIAYANAVSKGKYEAGQKVVIEFAFYDVESNRRMANWVKAQYERVFNKTVEYNGQLIEFEIELNGLNQAQFTSQRNNGDFDLCFTGMSGATFQATFGMGYIFSRTFSTFLVGRGHDTGNLPVRAEIPYLTFILKNKLEKGEELEEHEEKFLEKVDDEGVFVGKFDDLFNLFSDTTNFQVEYVGIEEDLTNITAALEKALLDQMIAIPLFSATSAAVLSNRVIRMAPSYSLFMGWGGLTYTHIKAAK